VDLAVHVHAGRDRPYIDGSLDNNAFAMVFGYNGLERFGISVPGSVTSGPGVVGGAHSAHGAGGLGGGHGSGAAPGSGGTRGGAGLRGLGGLRGAGGFRAFSGRAGGTGFGTGCTNLLGSTYGPEIGWLYPLAILALICGLLWTWRARRDDPVRGGFVMWGLWLVTFLLIFSKMTTIPHTAYVASLAPALAALSAAVIVMFWRLYRARDRRGWMLPVAVSASVARAAFLWRSYSGFLPWLRDAAVAVGAAAVIVMIVGFMGRSCHRVR
jgi:4-amino-4-deoxy-L-arabinose transferase-like glycosyltransferase